MRPGSAAHSCPAIRLWSRCGHGPRHDGSRNFSETLRRATHSVLKNPAWLETKSAYRQLEDVVGCKWSVSVLQAVAAGISRPGALERHIQGISTKVLSERLRKLTRYGLLARHAYAEVPPRTEYSLTPNGQKLVKIIDQIKLLDEEIKSAE